MNRSSVASAQSRSLKLARWRGEFQPLKDRADALEREVADLNVKAGRSSAVGHAPATPIRDRYGVIVGYQGGGGGSGPRPLHEGEAARIRLPPTSRRSWRAAGSDARRLTVARHPERELAPQERRRRSPQRRRSVTGRAGSPVRTRQPYFR